ncbi:MAG: bifunctional oligoribonuclease/PAP phosphatase NrnA [bacterium]|nr:bifunctional oligoribonuclease/PAP phosphatase NrnA [bacterium]
MQLLTCQTSAERLRAARTVLIGGHLRPDGDCLGAMAALGLGLRALGSSVTILMPEPIPSRYRFLAHHFLPTAPIDPPDLIVILDTADPQRIALPHSLHRSGAPLLVIDHHVAGAHEADFLWCDPSYGAAAAMVCDLLDFLACPLSPAIAEAIYTGILTDTGCFTYPNADERIFALALRLVRQGLDTARIARDVYQSVPLAATRLLAAMLATLESHDEGRIAIMHITLEMLHTTGATQADTEDLINVARAIDSVLIAALVTEQPDGRVRLSLRSKDPLINVGLLAHQLGGGGHLCASGATLHEPLASVLARLPTLLRSFLAESLTPLPTRK